MIHFACFPELPNLLGAWICQALPSSDCKLSRQLIYSYMFSRANWADSQKELERVSHSSCLLSYSKPCNATPSLVLAVMLMGPLLWQFNSLHSRKPSTLLGLFSATSASWTSSQQSQSHTQPKVSGLDMQEWEWDHSSGSAFVSWNQLLNCQSVFRSSISGERGAHSSWDICCNL